MKKILVNYGMASVIIVVGVPVISSLFMGNGRDSFSSGEVIGYSSIIVAMSLIYFAARNYRDKVNKGVISFGQSMKIGLSISAMGGIAWGIYNLIFVTFIMPDFNKQYFAHTYGLEIGSAKFETEYAAMMEANGFFMTVAGGTLLMFLTVFLIGFVISVISGLVLQSRTKVAGI